MSETTSDEPNDDTRLMTSIDGEAARLLVHIEPIEEAEGGPTDADGPPQASPPDGAGLSE